MGVQQIELSQWIGIEDDFSPVPNVIPGIEQRDLRGLILFHSERVSEQHEAFRSYDAWTHTDGKLSGEDVSDLGDGFARMQNLPGPRSSIRRNRWRGILAVILDECCGVHEWLRPHLSRLGDLTVIVQLRETHDLVATSSLGFIESGVSGFDEILLELRILSENRNADADTEMLNMV